MYSPDETRNIIMRLLTSMSACLPLTKVKTKDYSQEKPRFQMDEHVHINKSHRPAWHSHERRSR
jgi:hypothetical protein